MKMIIESKDNKHFKEFKKLTAIDGVSKYGRVIIVGEKTDKGNCAMRSPASVLAHNL